MQPISLTLLQLPPECIVAIAERVGDQKPPSLPTVRTVVQLSRTNNYLHEVLDRWISEIDPAEFLREEFDKAMKSSSPLDACRDVIKHYACFMGEKGLFQLALIPVCEDKGESTAVRYTLGIDEFDPIGVQQSVARRLATIFACLPSVAENLPPDLHKKFKSDIEAFISTSPFSNRKPENVCLLKERCFLFIRNLYGFNDSKCMTAETFQKWMSALASMPLSFRCQALNEIKLLKFDGQPQVDGYIENNAYKLLPTIEELRSDRLVCGLSQLYLRDFVETLIDGEGSRAKMAALLIPLIRSEMCATHQIGDLHISFMAEICARLNGCVADEVAVEQIVQPDLQRWKTQFNGLLDLMFFALRFWAKDDECWKLCQSIFADGGPFTGQEMKWLRSELRLNPLRASNPDEMINALAKRRSN